MVNNDINAIFQYSIVLGHFTAVTQSKGREDTTIANVAESVELADGLLDSIARDP